MEQPKVAIIYHGMSGALQALAQEAAAGAEEVGAIVRVRRIPVRPGSASEPNGRLVTPDDVGWADAVVVGSPTRYGDLAPPLKSYLDNLTDLDGARFREIVWSGIAPEDGLLHGGHEATLMTVFRILLQRGGVVVSEAHDHGLDARAHARQTGRHVASVARLLLAGAATTTATGTRP